MWCGAQLMQKKQKNTWAWSSLSYLIPGETSGMIAAPFPWLMLQLWDDFTSTGYFGSICLPWETVGMRHPSLFVNGSASSLGKLRLESWWLRLCLCAVFVWCCTLRLIKSEKLQLLLISSNICFFTWLFLKWPLISCVVSIHTEAPEAAKLELSGKFVNKMSRCFISLPGPN